MVALLRLVAPLAPRDEEIVWRLVDAAGTAAGGDGAASLVRLEAKSGEPRGPARAVIDDDQRYTFARATPQLVYRDPAFALPQAEVVSFDVPLPPLLQGCRSLIAEVAMSGREARDARSVMAACRGTPPAERLAITAPTAPILRGKTVDVWIHAHRPIATAVQERRFAIGKVPPHARLELAYGIESAGWAPAAAAVAFEVAVAGEARPRFARVLDPATEPTDRHWRRAQVSLHGDAGAAITIVLRTALVAAPDREAFSVPVWGDPTIIAGREHGLPTRMNLVVIEIDTLRARSVGSYGGARPTTPFLDRLASGALLFETAVAQSTLTPVSNMSLFTALYPREHGITDLSRVSDVERYATLAELLRREGYVTGAVTEDGLLSAVLGFERGFDRYRENKSADLGSTVGHVEETFRAGLEWMAEHRALPFFLFLHTYQVHAPYTPPRAYQGLFGREAADLDRYEEEIRYVDDQLAQLWSALASLHLSERTLVIVTSDHGEEFGEHGALDHGSHLYDETLLVPFILAVPGRPATGVRVPQPVALIDVVPTVLDLLSLPPAARVDGISLAAFARVDSAARATLAAALERRPIYAEAWGATRVLADGTLDSTWHPPAYAVRTSTLKLIATPPRPDAEDGRIEAYDLADDVGERHDIFATGRDRFADSVHGLERYESDAAAAAAKATLASPGLTAPPALPDAATAEKLKALGYVR